MKTAQEITAAIEAKREEERLALVNWAKGLISNASEKMLAELQSSYRLETKMGYGFEFEIAMRYEEVRKLLEENGFEVYIEGMSYFLRIK